MYRLKTLLRPKEEGFAASYLRELSSGAYELTGTGTGLYKSTLDKGPNARPMHNTETHAVLIEMYTDMHFKGQITTEQLAKELLALYKFHPSSAGPLMDFEFRNRDGSFRSEVIRNSEFVDERGRDGWGRYDAKTQQRLSS